MHSDLLKTYGLLCWETHRKLKHALKLFYKSIRPHFLWVYWYDKPTWDVGRTLEKLVNHEPNFSRVLPTSRVGYHASKPIESVVYCLINCNTYVFNSISQAHLDGKDFCFPSVIFHSFASAYVRLHNKDTHTEVSRLASHTSLNMKGNKRRRPCT